MAGRALRSELQHDQHLDFLHHMATTHTGLTDSGPFSAPENTGTSIAAKQSDTEMMANMNFQRTLCLTRRRTIAGMHRR